jgi:hypothetical protein
MRCISAYFLAEHGGHNQALDAVTYQLIRPCRKLQDTFRDGLA